MALADEQPMPDELFRWSDAHRASGQDAGPAVFDPFLVDQRHAVSHPIDQIDEAIPDGRLREPVRVFEPRDESRGTQGLCGCDDRGWLEEEIEILGLAIDAGVLVDRIGARDNEAQVCRVDRLERAPVDLPFLLGNPEISMGQGFPFLGRQARRASSQVGHSGCLRCLALPLRPADQSRATYEPPLAARQSPGFGDGQVSG